jgi:hypothetical protein
MTLMTSGIAKKNGGTPEGARQGNHNMLSVTEKPEKASLLTKVGSEFITASPEKRAANWLDNQVARSQDKITTLVADLTPSLATVLLGRNDDNRTLREATVTGYARDMQNGSWDMNGEPIIVAANGLLNDGQHRCAAVIKADVAIPAVFIIGVDRNTRTTLDQGSVRRLSDYLAMDGRPNSVRLAALANYIWAYQNRGMLQISGRDKPTKSECIDLVNAHPNIAKSLQIVDGKNAHKFVSLSVLALAHWVFARRSTQAAADTFVLSLIEGANLDVDSPILYARNRLIAEHGKLRPNNTAELLFKAWNAYRRGDTLKRLVITGGQLPKLEK